MLKTKNKALFDKDTVSYTYKVNISKNPNDTIYGYNFKISRNTDEYLIYHYNNITYQIDSLNNRLVKENKQNYFYKQMLLPLSTFDDKNGSVSIRNKRNNLIVTKNIEDTEELKKVHWTYMISLDSQQIYKKKFYAEFQDTNQYDSWEFQDIDYLVHANIKDEIENLEKNSQIISFSDLKNNFKKQNPVLSGKAPTLLGVNLKNSEDFNLNELTANYVLLDFWFMACHPCIKSIPHLNRIHDNFNNEDLQIIGVNLKDKESKRDLLEAFVSARNIDYPIVLSDENNFKIQSFPTVLLLNEKRKIIYSHIGYSEENERKLDSILKRLNF
ncbi:peroxiredoxin family protein [Bizionia sp. KMM 8389]